MQLLEILLSVRTIEMLPKRLKTILQRNIFCLLFTYSFTYGTQVAAVDMPVIVSQ